MVDGYGQHKAGFEIEGKINRKVFTVEQPVIVDGKNIPAKTGFRIIQNFNLNQFSHKVTFRLKSFNKNLRAMKSTNN